MRNVNLDDTSSQKQDILENKDFKDFRGAKQYKLLNKADESVKKKEEFLEDLIKSTKALNEQMFPISKSISENFEENKNLNFLFTNKFLFHYKSICNFNNNNINHNTTNKNLFNSNIHNDINNLQNNGILKNLENNSKSGGSAFDQTVNMKHQLDLLQVLDHHQDKVWQIAWHPEEDLFASCGSDSQILIWAYCNDKYSLKAILEDSHTKTIGSISWQSKGKYLASTSFDSCISIWIKDGYDFECIAMLEGCEKEIIGLAWSSSGKYLATHSNDTTVWIWTMERENDYKCNTIIQAHAQNVAMIKWSPVDDVLFSSSYDNTIKIWGFSYAQMDWICLNTLNEHKSTILSI